MLINLIKTILVLCLCSLLTFSGQLKAQSHLQLVITIPELNVNPYHRPFVAVWLEGIDRQYVATIALWANDMEWYKDLRQWWRKAGRSNQPYDGVTGATKKPGQYKINWSGKDGFGNAIEPGTYTLKIEASREEGGRELIKAKITLDEKGRVTLTGNSELGLIQVNSLH